MSEKKSDPTVPDLTMPHLTGEAGLPTDQLREQLEKATAQTLVEQAKADDPRLKERYTFEFDWKDLRGRRWTGKFTNRILTVRERSLAGAMQARLAAGMPYSSLDSLTAELNLIISHMAFSLEMNEDRPDWSKDLRSVHDPALVQALFREVQAHEGMFLGWGQAETGGAPSAE